MVGGRVFFAADDGVQGRELWVTDGTTAGTELVRDLRPGPAGSDPRALTAFGDLLAFTALDRTGAAQVWLSDGTGSGRRTDSGCRTDSGRRTDFGRRSGSARRAGAARRA